MDEARGGTEPTMTRLEVRAPAKVNLYLRVLGRDPSGYHSIETLFLRLELADHLTIEVAGPGVRLEVSGDPTVPADGRNLCWKAAEAVARALGPDTGAAIRLVKRIPTGGGLGGGSSDAGAVLRALNTLLGDPLPAPAVLDMAAGLGSDVPFAAADVDMALGWERGRRLLPLPPPPSRPVLLLVPPYQVSARQAYAWLQERWAGAEGTATRPAGEGPGAERGCVLPGPEKLAQWETIPGIARNDLEEAVFGRHPDLRRAKDCLREAGAAPALLCGSGSCVFGVFENEDQCARAAGAVAERTGLGVLRTRTAGGIQVG